MHMLQDRLDHPILLRDELNATHTRYDYAVAAPSAADLQVQFAVLGVINAVVATACATVLLAMLRSKQVMQSSFNLYLIFIIIPDLLASTACAVTCWLSAPAGQYWSERQCGWQSWYLVFGFTANCWMNAVIVRELHKLLRDSHECRHYQPPRRQTVVQQAAAVYLYAALLALVGALNISWLPHKTVLRSGLACFPMEYDVASTVVYWVVFVPAFLGLPVAYAAYVAHDVLYRRPCLLPPAGRRRNLVIYFARLVTVYVVMWMPMMAICTVGNLTNISSWIYWSGAAWSHLQGLVSALISATKDDVQLAVFALWQCRDSNHDDDEPSRSRPSATTERRLSFLLRWFEPLHAGVQEEEEEEEEEGPTIASSLENKKDNMASSTAPLQIDEEGGVSPKKEEDAMTDQTNENFPEKVPQGEEA